MAKIGKSAFLSVLAIAMLLLLVAWMAGWFSQRVEPGLVPQTVSATTDVWRVEARSVDLTEAVSATLQAKQATDISSRILARIESIAVRAGDTVEQGQLLLTLEQTDLRSRVAQATESVKAAAARLIESEKSLDRARTLYSQGLVAVADLDQAQANRDALQADLASARQALLEAETAASFAEIRAPIDGRVIDRFAEPGDTAAPGDKLLSLYNPMSLRAEAQVREQLALALQLGQSLKVDIPALQQSSTAVIEELVPAADPGSRSFLIKARLQFNPALLPGMYARLQIPAGTELQILIPAERVVKVGQLNMIWVEEDGAAVRRFIRVGAESDDGLIHVVAGLNAGDRLLLPKHDPR